MEIYSYCFKFKINLNFIESKKLITNMYDSLHGYLTSKYIHFCNSLLEYN